MENLTSLSWDSQAKKNHPKPPENRKTDTKESISFEILIRQTLKPMQAQKSLLVKKNVNGESKHNLFSHHKCTNKKKCL
jgi:hypothetical protein